MEAYFENRDDYMLACTRIRGEVNSKKNEYRTGKKLLAINDPEKYAWF